MKPHAECYACFLKQALIASRLATDDAVLHMQTQRAVSRLLSQTDFSRNPPFIATHVFRTAYKTLGSADPYHAVKREYNRKVRDLVPELRQIMARSADPFTTAVRLALAGNIIDFGILEKFDLHGTLRETLRVRLAQRPVSALRQRAQRARVILYITDNAGEIGFDSFLIDEIAMLNPAAELHLAVKGGPIINDATAADARYFGLHRRARLTDTGSDWVGTHPAQCAPAFRRLFARADLIISKGQANWESLEELGDGRIAFLLKAKCPIVARALRVRLGDVVVRCPARSCTPARKGIENRPQKR